MSEYKLGVWVWVWVSAAVADCWGPLLSAAVRQRRVPKEAATKEPVHSLGHGQPKAVTGVFHCSVSAGVVPVAFRWFGCVGGGRVQSLAVLPLVASSGCRECHAVLSYHGCRDDSRCMDVAPTLFGFGRLGMSHLTAPCFLPHRSDHYHDPLPLRSDQVTDRATASSTLSPLRSRSSWP